MPPKRERGLSIGVALARLDLQSQIAKAPKYRWMGCPYLALLTSSEEPQVPSKLNT
jgi:hypothetical protein